MLKLASKIRLGIGVATTLAIAGKFGLEQFPAPNEGKVTQYQPVVQEMHGWTVHVDPALLTGEHSAQGKRSLSMLANHLERISLLVPGKQLQDMRKLELWIEHQHKTLQNMQYHPSAAWLRSHDCDIRLAKKVHIPIASNLLSRAQLLKHPAVILHELSHAYHDQVLGFGHPEILKAYNRSEKAGIYERVLLYRGGKTRHYARTNHKEFFAEMTESYLGVNDFYPFVRGELKEHDPETFALMAKIWGKI